MKTCDCKNMHGYCEETGCAVCSDNGCWMKERIAELEKRATLTNTEREKMAHYGLKFDHIRQAVYRYEKYTGRDCRMIHTAIYEVEKAEAYNMPINEARAAQITKGE